MAEKLLVNINDAAAMLSVSRSYFYSSLISTGRIKKIKLGRKTVFAVSALREFVKRESERGTL